MKPFLSFQGSRAGFFSDLFTGESCPLRIPFDRPFDLTPRWCSGPEPVERLRAMSKAEWLRAAVSPIPKPRKEQRPPASLSRNGFMVLPVRGISRQKRHPFPLYGSNYGAKAIIDFEIGQIQKRFELLYGNRRELPYHPTDTTTHSKSGYSGECGLFF